MVYLKYMDNTKKETKYSIKIYSTTGALLQHLNMRHDGFRWDCRDLKGFPVKDGKFIIYIGPDYIDP